MEQATLPVRLGGLGLSEASRSSSAAFVGSCNSSRQLSLRLLNDSAFMPVHEENDWTQHSSSFPGEVQCRQHLASLLPPTSSVSSSVSSTQHSFQKALDDALRSSIKVSLVSLREQAGFCAVAYPHAGAWLRAIPNSSLGLAMSPREFVTSLRLRLGIPVFPAPQHSVRCVCGHELDIFGDHTFGCGPLRIKRHDTLCDVIFHWLLLDNSNVRREQRCSSHSMTIPGDVFHPDFSLGKAAYFDIFLRNSFTPSHLINAAINSGAAAVAGEVDKDERHLANVSSYGCLFYPLVVESYGVWAAHSLQVLRSIVKKSRLSSGLSLGQASRQFQEQLSVRLWQYNSRLISDYLPNYYDFLCFRP